MPQKLIEFSILMFLVIAGIQAQESVGYLEAQPVYRTIAVDRNIADWEGIQPARTR